MDPSTTTPIQSPVCQQSFFGVHRDVCHWKQLLQKKFDKCLFPRDVSQSQLTSVSQIQLHHFSFTYFRIHKHMDICLNDCLLQSYFYNDVNLLKLNLRLGTLMSYPIFYFTSVCWSTEPEQQKLTVQIITLWTAYTAMGVWGNGKM